MKETYFIFILGSARVLTKNWNFTRTHACERYVAATSTVCGVEPLFEELSILKEGGINNFEVVEPPYDLKEILHMHNCQVVGRDSEESCKQLVEAFLKKRFNFRVASKQGVATLPQSVYSSRQVPDVAVYISDHIIEIIEVHSCQKKKSFINSIKKTILGLIDLLRYYKGICPKITKSTGFTFPKLETKKCVVKVDVEFKNFLFQYHLECIPLEEVRSSVLAVIHANRQRFQKCFEEVAPVQQKLYLKLSDEELGVFKHFISQTKLDPLTLEDIQQYPSTQALLISCAGRMWKFPSRRKDSCRLDSMSLLAELLEESGQGKFLINVKCWKYVRTKPDYFFGRGWVYYTKIKHHPMIPSEAAACLGHFMRELCLALGTLHARNYTHLDVRLENI